MRPRPTHFQFDPGHRLNNGCVAWFAAPHAGRRVANIAQLNNVATLNSGVSILNGVYGNTFRVDGGANGYLDLGSTNRFLPTNTTPFSVSWIESPETSPPATAGIATMFPGSGTQRWIMFRGNDVVIDGSHYGNLSCGCGSTTGITLKTCFLGPTQASGVGISRVFVLVGYGGMAGIVGSHLLYVDGQRYTATAGGAYSSVTTALNYFGWDGADNKYLGRLDNFRVWNRALEADDAEALCVDPFLGARPSSRLFLFATATTPGTLKTYNGLADASIKTFNGLARASAKTVNGLTP